MSYTWSQKFRLGALFAVVLVGSVVWYAGPGLLVGLWAFDWHWQQEWSPRTWLIVGGSLLINFGWARLTRSWLRDRMDKPLDRAVDWAMR